MRIAGVPFGLFEWLELAVICEVHISVFSVSLVVQASNAGGYPKHKVPSLRFAPVGMTELSALSDFTSDEAQSVCGIYVAITILSSDAVFCGHWCIALSRSQEQIILQSLLFRVEIEVAALQRVKLFVSAAFDDLALLDYQNLVSATDGGQPVGDDERRAALHQI
jgi:hypothetical protein